MKFLLLFAVVLAFAEALAAAEPAKKRPIVVEDLFKFSRVADPQVSPDGTQVVYQVTTVSLEKNSSTTALWLAATDGKTPPRQLTNPNGKKDTHPRWSPGLHSQLVITPGGLQKPPLHSRFAGQVPFVLHFTLQSTNSGL